MKDCLVWVDDRFEVFDVAQLLEAEVRTCWCPPFLPSPPLPSPGQDQ